MERRELTCINCPLGCALTAVIEDNGEITVTGNTCPRGAIYAQNELTDPRRIVTTTVRVRNGLGGLVSVKTAEAIPKDKIMDCIRQLAAVEAEAPVHIGDVILTDVAGTGINVVATKNYL